MPFMMSTNINPQMQAQQAQPSTLTLATGDGPSYESTPALAQNPEESLGLELLNGDLSTPDDLYDPVNASDPGTNYYDDGSGDFSKDPAYILGEVEKPFPWWLLFLGLGIGYLVRGGGKEDG